jgi:hypothetical protein
MIDPREYLNKLEENLAALGMAARSPSWAYVSVNDFILREGVVFTNITKARRLGPMKMCYKNALNLVWDDPSLIYVEGIYLNPKMPLPIGHAWACTEDGTVVDPTLRWSGKYGCDRKGHGYIGVPFDTDFAFKHIVEKGTYTLIDDWEKGFPLLREPLPDNAKRKVNFNGN